MPQDAQVSWQRTVDPGQPQWVWSVLHLGQAFDLDAEHAERSSRRAATMPATPGVDVDLAIQPVIKLGRLLRFAMRALIGETKRRAMQARSSTAWSSHRR